MIDATIIGGAIGALSRLAPEVLKQLDRANERKHELAMGEQQIKAAQASAQSQKEIAQVQADASAITAGLDAIKTAYQNMKTGFKFADVVSALIRPWVTVLVVSMWLTAKIAAYVVLAHGGMDWSQAIATGWGDSDWAMLSGILNFWFLGRVFEKRN